MDSQLVGFEHRLAYSSQDEEFGETLNLAHQVLKNGDGWSSENSGQGEFHGGSYGQEMRTLEQILDVKKQAAAKSEEFEKAKRLKAAIAKLKTAWDRLDKLSNDKNAAIEKEDYDKAERYKKEMDAIRMRTYDEIDISKLLTAKEMTDLGLENYNLHSRPPPYLKRSESAPTSNEPAPKTNPYLDRDNMVLPAIKNQQQQIRISQHRVRDDFDRKLPVIEQTNWQSGQQLNEGPTEEETDEQAIYRLHPKDVSQLAQSITTFGPKLVRNCTSKQWQERQNGLEELQLYLERHQFHDREDAYSVLTPTLHVLQRALKDKIFNVFKTATNVLRFILLTFLIKHKISKTGGSLVAERTYHALISRTGDSVSDPRFRPASIDIAENIVKKTEMQIAKFYASCFLRPFQASGHQKIDQAHAEIVERIVTGNEAPKQQLDLTEEKICRFAASCLQHTDAQVRQSGIRILTLIYKMGDREKIRSSLPRNTETTKKKWPLYKSVFDEFGRIDGKMGSRDGVVNGQNSPDGNKFKEENRQLKRQLTFQRMELGGVPKTPTLLQRYPASETRRFSQADTRQQWENNEHVCIFCGEVNHAFDEEMLDMHYLKYCPMLTKCHVCKKVVEISSLNEHYLYECTAKSLFKPCPRCKEPLLPDDHKKHEIHQTCQMAKLRGSSERCLLCHRDVSPNNEAGWRNHLTGPTGCSGNARKMHGVGAAKGAAGRRRYSTGAIDTKKLY